MKIRNSGLALTAVAVLALTPQLSTAQEYGQLKWQGKLYMKFLDGNRQHNFSMSNAFDTTPGESGGDQGQAMEFDLTLTSQVSKQVEFYARVQSRLHRAYWANYNGFAVPDRPNQTAPNSCSESDPRCNWYIKLRGARVILTPGYDWIDSVLDRQQRLGHVRRVDARQVALHRPRQPRRLPVPGLGHGQDPAVGPRQGEPAVLCRRRLHHGRTLRQRRELRRPAEVLPGADWNATLIASYTLDSEVDADDPNFLNGAGTTTRWDNMVIGARGQYSGLGFMDVNGAVYWSDYDIADDQCNSNDLGSCRYSPTLKEGTDDYSFYLTFDIPSCSSRACRSPRSTSTSAPITCRSAPRGVNPTCS